MSTNNIGKKLKELRVQANLTQKQAYEYVGVAQSTFSSWEIGKAEPPVDILLKLCQLYKVDDILSAFGYDGYNEDGSIRLNINEVDLIEKYRTLDDYGRETVRMILEREIERTKTMQEQADTISDLNAQLMVTPTRKRIFAYYGKIAAAGTSVGFEDMIEGTKEYDETDLNKRADYVIGVSGDSMEPTYHDGNIVYVKKTYDLKVGDIGIFQKDNGIYIKEVSKDALISHNAKYKPIKGDDGVICLGKVIGKAE